MALPSSGGQLEVPSVSDCSSTPVEVIPQPQRSETLVSLLALPLSCCEPPGEAARRAELQWGQRIFLSFSSTRR